MKRNLHFFRRAVLVLGMMICLILPVCAQNEIRGDEAYTFTGEEFSDWEDVEGVFITKVPDPAAARLTMGSRVIRPGDVVSAADLNRLVLRPMRDKDAEAVICFLPVCGGRLGEEGTFTMHVKSSRDEAPVAKNQSLETYRNVPNSGVLRAVNDDEGSLRFRLEKQPKRGTVELREDGSFTYTPKRNKVGEDAFTFSVTDEAGNVSNTAKVEIRILRPTDAKTFADLPADDQFTALWLRQTGLFGGEQLTDRLTFGPEKTVSRGEFLCMTMKLADIEPDVGLRRSGFVDESLAPAWMRPYLASAMRRGIVRGYRTGRGLEFRPDQPITGAQAAVILARTFGKNEATPVSAMADAAVPAWARAAVATLNSLGIACPEPNAPLTRQQTADLLYAAWRLR